MGVCVALPGAAGPPIKIGRKTTIGEMARKMGISPPAVASVSDGGASITVPVTPTTTAAELVRQLARPPEPAPAPTPAPSAPGTNPPTWLILMFVLGEILLLWFALTSSRRH